MQLLIKVSLPNGNGDAGDVASTVQKKQSRCSKKCHSDKKSILISGKTVAARQLLPRAVSLPVTKSIVTLMSVVQQSLSDCGG